MSLYQLIDAHPILTGFIVIAISIAVVSSIEAIVEIWRNRP